MIIPAPGILGIVIGGCCVLAIAIRAMMWLLDGMATRLLGLAGRLRGGRNGKSRRNVHAGSGIARKSAERVRPPAPAQAARRL
ncbi:hypothetical protein [Methylobacterium sp. BTF04]|uniref:hypothetical protein n=1 Tax=Methylobacterium sp. BTF04 TaxID=2708300 RepID=UPI001FF04736|nr:hypothetical protein [Methylobacterium sp. BTF04]